MAEYRRVVSLDGSTSYDFQEPCSSGNAPPAVPSRPQSTAAMNKQNGNKQNRNGRINRTVSLFGKGTKDANKASNDTRPKPEAKKPTVFYKINEPAPTQTRPTIIRSAPAPLKKKQAPPRPPPPKLNQSSASVQKPPSYEEVVQADIDAFIGEMRTPRPPPAKTYQPTGNPLAPNRPAKLPGQVQSRAPPRPAPMGSQQQQQQTDLLIDFDSPLSSPRPPPPALKPKPVVQQPQSQHHLDLDSIFSCNGDSAAVPFSSEPHTSAASTSSSRIVLGPRVLPMGPIPNLHPIGSSKNGSSHGNNQANLARQTSKGDDWLQSCLNSTSWSNGASQSDGTLSFRDPTSPLPPLPPRPSAAHFDFSIEPSISPEPPSALPPPVPPLPLSHSPLENDLPPLPPRPKQIQPSRPHAVAIHNYVAQHEDELSFKAAEVITLIHRVNDEWLYGYSDENEGMFPQNFVKIVISLPDDREDDGTSTLGPRCQALYDFIAESETELSFSAGDVIALVSRESNEWLTGTLFDATGVFPATFVQIIEDLPPSSNLSEGKNCLKKNDVCIALYDFVGQDNELSFAEGESVVITGIVNDEWLEGKLKYGGAQSGRFPKSFVQKMN